MSSLDRAVLAERVAVVQRHLTRVADRLPALAADLQPATDISDAVVLHLWQATQIVIDVGLSACVALKLGTPSSYADAFRRLEQAAAIDHALADRLVRAAGFRNVVAHAYDTLDMASVHHAATVGPADLLAFLSAIRDRLPPREPRP